MSNRVRIPPRYTFIAPCLPSTADHPPTGQNWVHEIKHDGYRLMARRDPVGIRLLTRNGHDWADRYPLIVECQIASNSDPPFASKNDPAWRANDGAETGDAEPRIAEQSRSWRAAGGEREVMRGS